jgi:RNA polymerase sigma factor (sigma-70 family)
MATAARVTPISQDRSDVELVAAVRRGSDAAFEELYSRYGQRIGGYVRGMVGDHGRAEDVTQEIFIAALRRMRETDRPINFKPWIYEIAKNACIDSFRRTRRAQEVSLDADDSLSSADRGRLTVVTTPDAALDSKEALNDLRGAFGGLSESHHEILVLRELEGRSYSDIGERLGMSRPVVESTLFRARRRLAEEYDDLSSGRRCEFVHKMVDSGPHYSLGIRDRRRIARHLAHCQACRAHARAGGFDESILNMPGVAVKIAALLPIPLLRVRGVFEHFGSGRGRPSMIALRSVHTLARSSDQIVASASAGRSAATAAAIVLAGVGGGIVSETASQPAKPPHHRAVHASAYRPLAPVEATRAASRPAAAPRKSVAVAKTSVTSTGASSRGAGRHAAVRPTAKPEVPATTTPTSSAPNASGTPATISVATVPTAAGNGGAAAATPPDADSAGPTIQAGGSPPTKTPPPPIRTAPAGASPTGILSSTLGGVTGGVPTIPTVGGTSSGSAPGGPLASTIKGVTTGLGHLLGSP